MDTEAVAGRPEQDFLGRLVAWAEGHELVRAALLTSTRASASASVDALSDYDVALYVSEMAPFRDWNSWLPGLGTVLLGNTPEERENRAMPEYVHGVFFDDMTKVDFIVAPAAVLALIREEPRLPDDLDLGYRVLVDKDGLTVGMKPPTDTAFIPRRPTAQEYRQLVEEFWSAATYVAKYLWRGETFGARAILDAEIRLHALRPMLTWAIEVEHGWSVRTGAWGRQIRRYLEPGLWAEVEATFGGSDDEGHWRALFRTTAVFRRCAESVATSLGYSYPGDLDDRMTTYLLRIKALPTRDQGNG